VAVREGLGGRQPARSRRLGQPCVFRGCHRAAGRRHTAQPRPHHAVRVSLCAQPRQLRLLLRQLRQPKQLRCT
jgi:hypothetical protein